MYWGEKSALERLAFKLWPGVLSRLFLAYDKLSWEGVSKGRRDSRARRGLAFFVEFGDRRVIGYYRDW